MKLENKPPPLDFVRVFFLLQLAIVVLLASCAQGVSPEEQIETSQFLVQQVEQLSSDFEKSQTGDKQRYYVTMQACVKEIGNLEPIVGQKFSVGEGSVRTSDDRGCIQWPESIDFLRSNDETYYKLERTVRSEGAYQGAVLVSFALNPWQRLAVDLRASIPQNLNSVSESTVPQQIRKLINQPAVRIMKIRTSFRQTDFELDAFLNLKLLRIYDVELEPFLLRRYANETNLTYERFSEGRFRLTIASATKDETGELSIVSAHQQFVEVREGFIRVPAKIAYYFYETKLLNQHSYLMVLLEPLDDLKHLTSVDGIAVFDPKSPDQALSLKIMHSDAKAKLQQTVLALEAENSADHSKAAVSNGSHVLKKKITYQNTSQKLFQKYHKLRKHKVVPLKNYCKLFFGNSMDPSQIELRAKEAGETYQVERIHKYKLQNSSLHSRVRSEDDTAEKKELNKELMARQKESREQQRLLESSSGLGYKKSIYYRFRDWFLGFFGFQVIDKPQTDSIKKEEFTEFAKRKEAAKQRRERGAGKRDDKLTENPEVLTLLECEENPTKAISTQKVFIVDELMGRPVLKNQSQHVLALNSSVFIDYAQFEQKKDVERDKDRLFTEWKNVNATGARIGIVSVSGVSEFGYYYGREFMVAREDIERRAFNTRNQVARLKLMSVDEYEISFDALGSYCEVIYSMHAKTNPGFLQCHTQVQENLVEKWVYLQQRAPELGRSNIGALKTNNANAIWNQSMRGSIRSETFFKLVNSDLNSLYLKHQANLRNDQLTMELFDTTLSDPNPFRNFAFPGVIELTKQ